MLIPGLILFVPVEPLAATSRNVEAKLYCLCVIWGCEHAEQA